MDLSESLYANNFPFALRVRKSASTCGDVKKPGPTGIRRPVLFTCSGFRIHSSRRVAAELQR